MAYGVCVQNVATALSMSTRTVTTATGRALMDVTVHVLWSQIGCVTPSLACPSPYAHVSDVCVGLCCVVISRSCHTCTTLSIAECGNGQLDGDENCDDGNQDSSDGCDYNCNVEGDFYCNNLFEPSVCSRECPPAPHVDVDIDVEVDMFAWIW